VAPANADLVGAEIELITAERREWILADALATVKDRFDYVVIDCPPSLGMLTLNALCAADGVVVPMQAEYFALEGISSLSNTIERVRTTYNPRLAIDGVLFCMFDARTNLSAQVKGEVQAFFGAKVFDTLVPRNVRLSEAPSHGKPALLYDFRSPGAQELPRGRRRVPGAAPRAGADRGAGPMSDPKRPPAWPGRGLGARPSAR
jgi:chromosome partitioning protein